MLSSKIRRDLECSGEKLVMQECRSILSLDLHIKHLPAYCYVKNIVMLQKWVEMDCRTLSLTQIDLLGYSSTYKLQHLHPCSGQISPGRQQGQGVAKPETMSHTWEDRDRLLISTL